MFKRKLLLAIFCFIFLPVLIRAQCPCAAIGGGVGTAGARFGMASAGAGTFQFQLVYDANYMDQLFDGSVRLENNDLERMVHTGIFGVNYGASRNLSLSAVMMYIGQEMASTRPDGRATVPVPVCRYAAVPRSQRTTTHNEFPDLGRVVI